MVATPIGNLADISLRAVHVLGLVQAVACEDTRVAATLLRHLGLQPPLLALHAHNEHEAAAKVLARLASGESVAYVSDAGTPAVSDPGAALVALAAAAGHTVVPVPGASSALAALSVAGDIGNKGGSKGGSNGGSHGAATSAGSGFHFVGFLPARGNERQSALAACVASAATQVVFEAPHRIAALAADLAAATPTRRVTLCRELTKQFETVVTQAAAALPAWLAEDDNRLRGEFVLVLHAQVAVEAAGLPTATLRTLRVLLRDLPLKQAVALAAEITGAPRNALYERALADREADRDTDREAAGD